MLQGVDSPVFNMKYEKLASWRSFPETCPPAKIQEAAREHNADLIMVGRSRAGAVELGVQVPILKIDHHADCPVLSIF